MVPLQERVMSFQFQIRKKANVWTDQRAKIILEVLGMHVNLTGAVFYSCEDLLGAMRVVKYFSYEVPFLKRTHFPSANAQR